MHYITMRGSIANARHALAADSTYAVYDDALAAELLSMTLPNGQPACVVETLPYRIAAAIPVPDNPPNPLPPDWIAQLNAYNWKTRVLGQTNVPKPSFLP